MSVVCRDNNRVNIRVIILDCVNINIVDHVETLRIEGRKAAFGSHCEEAKISWVESKVLTDGFTRIAEYNLTLVAAFRVIEGAHSERK